MNAFAKYTMLQLGQLLPIRDRNAFLCWLKGKYNIAAQAVRSGYHQTVVLELGERVVTSEELLRLIDVREGKISPEMARFLVDLMHSDKLPNDIYAEDKSIDSAFYQFALQA
ncbi:hypothetical protein [Reinekea sp. G2M2-21]|uniref:hypothetical protein n=1 Tax=Reinekea sp. G2M2-21 TaxID=2788942 RepID=UPI0018A8E3AB|nr:hypothetical protein [Reinekea sp. G2M2-21]